MTPLFGRYGLPPGKPVNVDTEATSAGAGNTDCSLGPAAGSGEVWIVAWALLFHDDDAAARNVQWRHTDGTTNMGLATATSDAANVYRQLYEQSPGMPIPFVLDENTSLVARGVDLVAGHKVEVRAAVYKIKGMHLLE